MFDVLFTFINLYPFTSDRDLAFEFGITKAQVKTIANILKMVKSPEARREAADYLQRQQRELIQRRGGDQGNHFMRPVEKVARNGRVIETYDSVRRQQNIFLAADLPERYGYRLISEEKHTRRRDTILRLCLAASLSAEEVQEALILYGMAPLHPRFPRDAALLAAIHNRLYDVHEVDALLRNNGFPPLLP